MRLSTLGTGLVPPAGRRPAQLVLFFDGQCGLCNALVDLALAADREQRLRFSPLQGQLAARTLTPALRASPASVLLLRDGAILARSDAVLELARQLGGLWRLAGILRLVPRPVRDLAYGLVARNRCRWFGRRETCRVPTERERERFIP